jgi:hypothetical protein
MLKSTNIVYRALCYRHKELDCLCRDTALTNRGPRQKDTGELEWWSAPQVGPNILWVVGGGQQANSTVALAPQPGRSTVRPAPSTGGCIRQDKTEKPPPPRFRCTRTTWTKACASWSYFAASPKRNDRSPMWQVSGKCLAEYAVAFRADSRSGQIKWRMACLLICWRCAFDSPCPCTPPSAV